MGGWGVPTTPTKRTYLRPNVRALQAASHSVRGDPGTPSGSADQLRSSGMLRARTGAVSLCARGWICFATGSVGVGY